MAEDMHVTRFQLLPAPQYNPPQLCLWISGGGTLEIPVPVFREMCEAAGISTNG